MLLSESAGGGEAGAEAGTFIIGQRMGIVIFSWGEVGQGFLA